MRDSLFWFEHVFVCTTTVAVAVAAEISAVTTKLMCVCVIIEIYVDEIQLRDKNSYRMTEKQRNEKGPKKENVVTVTFVEEMREPKKKNFNQKIDKIRQIKRSTK